MTAFNQALNTDINNKLTSSVYDDNLASWIQKSQMHVLSSAGILIPLSLDANGRLQTSIKDAALPEGASTAANQATVLSRIGEVQVSPTANTLLDRLKALTTALGEVQASPTANTALDRLKVIAAEIGALADVAVYDPATNGSLISLLKGLLKQLQGTGTAGTAAPVQGIGADDAAPVGPPVLVSGRFDTTPTTRQTGDKVTQQMTAKGAAHTTEVGADTLIELNLPLTGVAQQLASNACKNVTIQAEPGNVGYVYVGRANTVSSTVHSYVLSPGGSVTIQCSNTNLLYVLGTSGDKICGGGEVNA